MEHAKLVLQMVLERWHSLIKICNGHLANFTDEQILREIAPGKNRGIYILGHLIAVHDAMRPLLGSGELQYPHMREMFITAPDKSVASLPELGELRTTWSEQTETLNSLLDSIPVEEWFTKHTSVSQEDFEREPHRNKLNILLTRTSHLSYHVGQLALLK